MATAEEMTKRAAAMKSGCASLGDFCNARVRKSTKRAVLISFVIEAGLSGLTAVAPSVRQLHALTGVVCKHLRVFEVGRAFDNCGIGLQAEACKASASRCSQLCVREGSEDAWA